MGRRGANGLRIRRVGLTLLAAVLLGLGPFRCEPEPEPPPEPVAPAPPPVEEEPRRLFLWVLAEGAVRTLDDVARIPALLEEAEALGATDLLVQVYRGGRAWFDSDWADAAPYEAARDVSGVDPLAHLVHRAQAQGLRVHAWVNVLSMSRNAHAPLLDRLGRDAILVDRQGRSLLDYPDYDVPQPDRRYLRMGTPGLYLDPAAPGVAEELVGVFSELVARYPQLDGLHLDYIRYPDVLPFAPGSRFGVGLDFGYGEATRARFAAETGAQAPLGDSLRNANAWDAWRRDKLSDLVRQIAAAARERRPGLELSAAVWTYADRAYLVLGQDWRRWLEEGWLDLALPMSYTLDSRLLRYMAEHFAGRPDAARIAPGLGSWLFAKRPEGAVEQLRLLDEAGVRDRALFSYDSIATAPELRDALRRELGPGAAEPESAAPGDSDVP